MKGPLLVLLATLSTAAFANDGGVVGLKVDDLNFQREVYNTQTEKTTTTPITMGESEEITATFKGNVGELMKWLPGQASVTPEITKHYRQLTFAAKEGYVTINCFDANVDYNDKGKVVVTPKTPSCSVTLKKYTAPVEEEYITDLFGDFQDLSVPPRCQMK